MPNQTAHYPVKAYRNAEFNALTDVLAIEEPLELRVDADPAFTLSLMMRTPGHDRELVTGWLWAEGLLDAVDALELNPDTPNVVALKGDVGRLRGAARASLTSAACGVCGSGSVERLSIRAEPVIWTAPPLSPQLILDLPERLRAAQTGFNATGGLHAAGLFSAGGELLCAYEDVGRHNATDKVVGWAALRGELPLSNRILVTSSRAGFEIVQKAALAGVAVVVTVGAASSLAADTAAALNLSLLGFVRGERFNVYAGGERVQKI
ncbi:formate dehydrogenase accessory sulfurtransferase FdhD [Deinococcus detaillensis]|uniref:Sulfur carrier protein FdhD n=1 Tax=Deinococcus detaillensis TaxID=2592048 RepID=A0A553USC1_9DEIO|nr:formate dehydrogenase accessory sulfurtransferase FdhD [Deinococcus detaillensis]TSA83117.1 formate dehydrogenase accessory sulfurtransferase FdhD [Deinococcus detaillensis]